MKYLSNCSLVKNEDPYIEEFYKIHKYLGVEFFLFFDRSTEGRPLKEIFKNCNDVEIIHFPEPNKHAEAWREGMRFFKGKSKWVQFIDIDQVVVPVQHQTIPDMLKGYDQFAALSLNWHTFGSNNRLNEFENGDSTYDLYTKRAVYNSHINRHVQSLVQPERAQIKTWLDPHHPILLPGNFQVNENNKKIAGPFNYPPSQNVGFVAHYYTRSKEFWDKKCARLRADTLTPYSGEPFDKMQTYLNNEEDLRVKHIWKKANETVDI